MSFIFCLLFVIFVTKLQSGPRPSLDTKNYILCIVSVMVIQNEKIVNLHFVEWLFAVLQQLMLKSGIYAHAPCKNNWKNRNPAWDGALGDREKHCDMYEPWCPRGSARRLAEMLLVEHCTLFRLIRQMASPHVMIPCSREYSISYLTEKLSELMAEVHFSSYNTNGQ